MKFFASLLFFLPLFTTGQLRIVNTRLVNPDSAYLYIGVPNTLQVIGQGNKSSLQMRATNAIVQKVPGKNEFTLLASSPGADTVQLYKNGRCVLTKIYQINRVSDPVLSLGKANNKTLAVNEIVADPGLYILLPGCYLDASFAVVSFEVAFVSNNEDIVAPIKITGSQLDAACIDIVKKLLPGNQVLFDNIKAAGPDGKIRTLPGFIVTIR